MRRRVAIVLSMTAFAVAVLPTSNASGASKRVRAARTVETAISGAFAGTVKGAPIAVAVVADEPTTEGATRRISMYVCNGTSLAAWLTADTPGNAGALRSADHQFNAKLTLSGLTASGVLVLPTGRQYEFKVFRTANVAGLFDVTISSTGSIRGTSSTGATLTGRVGSNGAVVAAASAGSTPVDVTTLARHVTPGTYRWIILADGTVYGANKRGPGFGGLGGLVPTTNGTARIKAGGAGQKGYGDKKCGGLANKVNSLQSIEAKATKNGDTATADRAHDAKAGILQELEDHCLVIQE